ncbi:MAG: hypothetical protein QOI55_440, partial [Actinomycetota bacterium]|nr:hypothetical protein [Actinomycetota bacterium]
NVVAGTIAVVLGALIAHRIAGPRAGLCAGIVLALYPPLIANDASPLVESFAVLLLFACVLLLVDGRTVLAGAALGLMMLDRASAQWLVIGLGAWIVWRFGWRHALRFAAVAVLVVSPWVIRNWVHAGGPVIVATNGFNLNAMYSSEARQDDGFVDAYFDPRFAAMRVAAIDEVDLDGMLRRHALRDLEKHPGQLAHVLRYNMSRWFELRPSLNEDPERRDGHNLDVRAATWFLFFPITALGAFGLLRARRSPGAQLLMLAAGYFTIVCAVSIAVPRLRSVFDACAAVGAGVAIAWLIGRRLPYGNEPPQVRALRGRASIVIIAVTALSIGAGALTWRHVTEHHARQSVANVLARDTDAVDVIAREIADDVRAQRPLRLDQGEVDRLRELVRVLGVRAPEVSAGLRRPVGDALRVARVATQEVYAVGLLSAGEYLHPATGTPSLDRVRNRYEREVRPANPTLRPWFDVVSGRDLRELHVRLDGLHATLAKRS